MYAIKSLVYIAAIVVANQGLAINKSNQNEISPFNELFDIEKNDTLIVQTIDSIRHFQELHPNVAVEELAMYSNVGDQIVYTLGSRVAGDRLVGHSAKNQNWPRAMNVVVQLTYPAQGVGAMVTYIYVVVNQSTKLGRAYVARGGIHEHFITVVVEAYSTTYVNYVSQIYGI